MAIPPISLSRRVIASGGIKNGEGDAKSLVKLSGPMPALQLLGTEAIQGKALEVQINITAPRLREIKGGNFRFAHGSIQIRGSKALKRVSYDTFEKFNKNDAGGRSVFSEPEDDG